MDQILVIQGLPNKPELYSREFIRDKFIDTIKNHGARILNPSTDIIFVNDDSAVIIIDGFDHMALVKDEDVSKLEPIVDSDVEAADENGQNAKPS